MGKETQSAYRMRNVFSGIVFPIGAGVLIRFLISAPVVLAAPSETIAPSFTLKDTVNAPGNGSSSVIDMVLASIDGEPVTMSDLKKFIAMRGEQMPGDVLDGSPEIRRYLKELVVDELIEREAAGANITVSDEEIEAYMEEIQRQNGVDREGFMELLKAKGLSPDTYRNQIKADIMRTRILSSRVRNKVNILDEEIDKYVEAHPKLMPKSGEEHLQQVTFSYSDDADREEVRDRAEKARAEIADGASPDSISGAAFTDLGFVDPDDLKDELQDSAKALKPGETSDLIEAGNSFVILRLAGDKEKQAPDQEVREQVRRELMEERFKEAADKFLNEDLPKKYHVELKL